MSATNPPTKLRTMSPTTIQSWLMEAPTLQQTPLSETPTLPQVMFTETPTLPLIPSIATETPTMRAIVPFSSFTTSTNVPSTKQTPGAAVLPDEDSDFSDNEPSSVPSSFPSSDLSMIPPSAPFIPDDSDGQQEEYEELEEEIEEYADEITSIPTSSPNFNVTAINSTMCPPIIASVKGETSLEDSLLSSRALLYASLGLNVILLILMALCGLLLRKDQRRRRIATAAQPPPPAPGEEKASTVELSANVPPQMHELEAAMALPRERHRSNSLDASEEYVCRENSICVKNGEPKMKGYRYGTMGSES